MSTAIIEPKPEQPILILSVTPETIQATTKDFLQITLDDGKEAISTARKACVKLRTTCEKEMAALKEPALRECQKIDKAKRELMAMIEKPEGHLIDLEMTIKEQEAAIEKARIDALVASRVESLTRIGWTQDIFIDRLLLGSASDDKFNEYRMTIAKQIAERRDILAQREELRKQQEELAKQKAELQAEQDRIRAEQEATEKADRERRQAEINQKLNADRAALVERLKPDFKTLCSVPVQLSAIVIPDVSDEARYARTQIGNVLSKALKDIEEILEGMVRV